MARGRLEIHCVLYSNGAFCSLRVGVLRPCRRRDNRQVHGKGESPKMTCTFVRSDKKGRMEAREALLDARRTRNERKT